MASIDHPSAGPEPEFVSLSEWSRISGLSKPYTYRLLRRGAFKAIRVGKRTLIDLKSARAWLYAQPGWQSNGAHATAFGRADAPPPRARKSQKSAPTGRRKAASGKATATRNATA